MIVAGGGPMAARTYRLRAAAGSHENLDGAFVWAKPSLLVDEARKVMALIEDSIAYKKALLANGGRNLIRAAAPRTD
jgi:hypothetical protein